MTRDWGLAVLRATIGMTFLAHGAPKLLPLAGLVAPPVVLAGSLGAGGWAAILVGLVESFGGLALLAGARTSWVAPVLGFDRLAGVWLYRTQGYFINWELVPAVGHGYEYDLVLVGALACLMLAGPGALSWDERQARSAEAAALGRARLRSR
jgi:putative oxidoreductase